MTTALCQNEERPRLDVERWFRQLDQRLIYKGPREWVVQVTGILMEEDVIWIQIADDSRWCGSVLLRIRDSASVEQAVGALTSRKPDPSVSYPKVITVPVHPRIA